MKVAPENVRLLPTTVWKDAPANTAIIGLFSLPSLACYGGALAMVLGMLGSNGWLFGLGLALAAPGVIFVLIVQTIFRRSMRNMYLYPDLYRTEITEDAQGNFQGIRWVRIY